MLHIREAMLADVPALSELGKATFDTSFGHLYRPEDLQDFYDKNHAPQFYEAAIQNSDCAVWVVEDKTGFWGYCKVRPNTLPCKPPRDNALELARLYLHPKLHGQGWGSKLIIKVLQFAQDKGFADIVVSVLANNKQAQKAYSRHGFEKIQEYFYPVGKQLDLEWIMIRRF